MTRLLRTLPLLALAITACGKKNADQAPAANKDAPAAAEAANAGPQSITIDGSSTVLPVSEAMAEEFNRANKDVRITVAASGTGGGFKKFCAGEIQLAGASRPIKKSEADNCKGAGIEFIELPVAYDGLAVVVSKENDWAKDIKVAELKEMWKPEAQGQATKWSDIRAGWPSEPIHLFGAGVDSGTYDYFTMAVTGVEHSSRGDYNSSEDDNILVKGISTDKYALGFFGFAYYAENQDKLNLLAIDDENEENGKGAIAPSPETINDGSYQPLSRPIFIYVSKKAAESKHIADFVNFYLTQGKKLVPETGYVALPENAYKLAETRFEKRTTGSMFDGGSKLGVTIESLLAAEKL